MNIENLDGTNSDDLDTFSSAFFGEKESEPAKAPEEKAETEEVDDAPNEDIQDDKPEDKPDEADQPEDDDLPEEKPKKTRYQERIDDLTGKARSAERRAQELEEELRKIREAKEAPRQDTPPEKVQGPTTEDKNEDGTDKYPLGEFDPGFIRDLTKFTLAEERKAYEAEQAQKTEKQKAEQERAELQQEWQKKVSPAQERYPDFAEKTQSLEPLFVEVETGYAEYLASTLMEMDHGPDVLYYLANNPDEAKAIINGGARKATIALGKLDARFDKSEETKPKPRTTAAPPPPPTNKGSAPAKASVDPDTDDLDAFASEFFKKK